MTTKSVEFTWRQPPKALRLEFSGPPWLWCMIYAHRRECRCQLAEHGSKDLQSCFAASFSSVRCCSSSSGREASDLASSTRMSAKRP